MYYTCRWLSPQARVGLRETGEGLANCTDKGSYYVDSTRMVVAAFLRGQVSESCCD